MDGNIVIIFLVTVIIFLILIISIAVIFVRRKLNAQNLKLSSLSEDMRFSEELQSISIDLAVGLSEIFEMARRLTLGDVSSRIVLKTKNELILKLEKVLNQVADSMEMMVEDEHNMAIDICEHFDALAKISSGDLKARAPENSKVELIAKLGKLINQETCSLIALMDEQKRIQAQLVQSGKMASMGLLAGGVAHEINNPLAGILNNLHLIKMMAKDKKGITVEEFGDLLGIIEESALRCSGITKALLNFSRASKGIFQPCSLNEIINSTVLLIDHELKIGSTHVEKKLMAEIPDILADSQLLQQVIFNIINNAKWAIEKKFKNDGGRIEIKTDCNSETKEVFLLISDNGIGMGEQTISHIFEPFFTTKEIGEGTGLGLSIVYDIIRRHNGLIKVESKVGQGTVFKINFPAIAKA